MNTWSRVCLLFAFATSVSLAVAQAPPRATAPQANPQAAPVANNDAPDHDEAAAGEAIAADNATGASNEQHVHHHHHFYPVTPPPFYASPPAGNMNPDQGPYAPLPQAGYGGNGGYGGYGGYGRGFWGRGGWGGYGNFSSTAAQGYMQGQAAMTQAAGQYNLMTAEAARQAEAARAAYMQNQMTSVNDYFLEREANSYYRDQEKMAKSPPLTQEQLYQINVARLPKRLRHDQFNVVTGEIYWPDVLLHKDLAAERAELNKLFAERTHDNSGVGSENYHDVQMAVHAMQRKLHDDIKLMEPTEYLAAITYIDSLAFEARFPPSSAAVVTEKPAAADAPADNQ